jgi:hypothetical protein
VYRDTHGTPAPPPLTCDLLYCAASDAEAEATARVHMPEYYLSVLDHYELLTDSFQGVRGYEMYAHASQVLSSIGRDDQAQGYVGVQSFGSPETLIEKLRRRRDVVGEFELAVIGRYGSMPREKMRASMELFGREVLPELRRW